MRLPTTSADKEDKTPKSFWDHIVSSTPVVMTVLATILAGISSSEMTRAQYQRSLAAQQQSKAGDQWGFFQAHRLRNFEADNTLGLLQTMGGVAPADAEDLRDPAARVSDGFARVETEAQHVQQTAPADKWGSAATEFFKAAHDRSTEARPISANFIAALGANVTADAVRGNISQAKPVTDPSPTDASPADAPVDAAINEAARNADALELSTKPAVAALATLRDGAARLVAMARELERQARALTTPNDKRTNDGKNDAAPGEALALLSRAIADLHTDADLLNREVTAAQLRYSAARYAREAQFNQVTARLYDEQVARRSAEAERHQRRSRIFFYIMLLAQGGVTFSTLSLAMRKRSVLWTLAALAGITAAAMGSYVYAFI